METTPTIRQANTRRDGSGGLTRDQRRERERPQVTAPAPAPAPGPGVWVKRGVQPEVPPTPPSAFSSLMHLAAEIREEHNPAARAMLEERYRLEAVAAADLTLDPRERHLRELCTELLATFRPLVDGEADLAEPEVWTRGQWLAFHKRLVVCRRRSMQWVTTSRRFASERWGADYVSDAEAAAPPTPAPASV